MIIKMMANAPEFAFGINLGIVCLKNFNYSTGNHLWNWKLLWQWQMSLDFLQIMCLKCLVNARKTRWKTYFDYGGNAWLILIQNLEIIKMCLNCINNFNQLNGLVDQKFLAIVMVISFWHGTSCGWLRRLDGNL